VKTLIRSFLCSKLTDPPGLGCGIGGAVELEPGSRNTKKAKSKEKETARGGP